MQRQSSSQQQVQKQQLSITQLQSLHMLSLTNAEVYEVLQQEYNENPFLEHTPAATAGPVHNDALHFIAAPAVEPMKHFLLEQLNPKDFSHEAWAVITLLAARTDDRGFLDSTALDLPPAMQQLVPQCLMVLQQLEPPGICTASPAVCLKEQLRRRGQLTPLACAIIDKQLVAVARNDLKLLSTATGLPKQALLPVLAAIKALRPYPMHSMAASDTHYIIPDVIVSENPSGIQISINDNWMGSYGCSSYYLHALQHTGEPALKAYFQNKYQHCCLLLYNVEQRRQTLSALSKAVWEWQQGALKHKQPLMPMTLQDIANQLGVNHSTISRAIKGKYLQTPVGTMLFKQLFQHGLNNAVSQDAVKQQLANIIAHENKAAPFSDSELAHCLSEACRLTISRRAVTKYRYDMNIANSYDRKLHIK